MKRIAALAVLSLACSSDMTRPAPVPAYAVATPSCGPVDGPAVEIILSNAPITSLDPAAPFVRVIIFDGVDHLDGNAWTISTSGEPGAGAWHHTSATSFEIAPSGTVRVDSVSGTKTISGSLSVTFTGAGRISGEFQASWVDGAPMCG